LIFLYLQSFFKRSVDLGLYRIEKTLNNIANGKKVEFIKLRKKDFLKSLAESVNKVIEKINSTKL